ncbi:hypothetical protein WK43_23265 [Burkholderia ubonensis]|nr:hypothetical protein WM29_17915 [Burkholderia ubonensis]KVS41501.1 hypothetical protein WK37_20285 [Burkholderia ubonensis]KVS53885.1 hypothetical protein WK38_08215 [Burkholderia ubonensis]KVS70037.1 hypothetical protein WK42_29010 [Burkholderia ubonensis]KVS85077.1 hypothetical protein WK43_23265 [Burkholderia ubonensis]
MFHDHIARLRWPVIEREVARYPLRQCRTGGTRDHCKHQVGMGKRGAGGERVIGFDHHLLYLQGDGGKAASKFRREPPCRSRILPIQDT